MQTLQRRDVSQRHFFKRASMITGALFSARGRRSLVLTASFLSMMSAQVAQASAYSFFVSLGYFIVDTVVGGHDTNVEYSEGQYGSAFGGDSYYAEPGSEVVFSGSSEGTVFGGEEGYEGYFE